MAEQDVPVAAWRPDIQVLLEAARASCALCESDVPLVDGASHGIPTGIRVFCAAAAINTLMTMKKAVSWDFERGYA